MKRFGSTLDPMDFILLDFIFQRGQGDLCAPQGGNDYDLVEKGPCDRDTIAQMM